MQVCNNQGIVILNLNIIKYRGVMRKNVIMFVVMIQLSVIFNICYAAAPPYDFQNSKVYVYVYGRVGDGGHATVREFVTKGLKPGKWSKGDSNQWVYRVVSKDAVKRENTDSAFSFVKTEVAESDTRYAVVLNRIVTNGKELNQKTLYQLFNNIYYTLPSVKNISAESKLQYNKDKQYAENKQRETNKLKYFGSYQNEVSPYTSSTNELKLSLIKNDLIEFNLTSNKYKKQGRTDIIIGDNICSLNNKTAKVEFKDISNDDVTFVAIYEEPECRIKIEPSTKDDGGQIQVNRRLGNEGSLPIMTVKVKGECSAYCKGSGSFDSLIDEYYKQETHLDEPSKLKDNW